MKTLINKDKMFLIKDPSKDVHTQYGFIKSDNLTKKPGTVLKTNMGKELTLLEADFLDKLKKIKRGAQVIPLKDIGAIIAETGINKNSKIIDSGAGSGYMALCFANVAKKVITYDVREDHLEIVKKNIEFMGFTNIEAKPGDFYEGIKEKNADVVNLDLPEPWLAIKPAVSALKTGGYIVSYSPTIPQVMDFANAVKETEELIFIKTIEIIEREWDVFGRKVRPKTQTIGHSGFLSFARKIR